MRALPMEAAATRALSTRAAFAAEQNFEAVELVEIDAVAAFTRLMSEGSPMLRRELISAALKYDTQQ